MKDGRLKRFLLPIIIKCESVYGCFFPYFRSKRLYKKCIGKKLVLKNPSTLNEKLMYYKFNLYWKNDLVNNCADKYKVREFVSECGLGHILNPIYGVWDKPSEIDWDILPDKFVLKLNSGSGCNIVCLDKNTFNKKEAIKKFKKWIRIKYGCFTAEQGIYSKIKKKIIAEKYIDSFKDVPPDDYKFFCSYGDVKMLFVACDRYNGNTKFDYYYPDWKWIDVKNAHPNKGPVPKPKNYEKMLEYASKLSKKFPLVRIDFYNIDGNIIFGEITFTHFGCVHPFDPDEYDLKFGQLFPDVKEANEIK